MKKLIIPPMIIAAGIALLGWFVRAGLESFTDRQRTVEVRGLAEVDVPADHVTWPIVINVSGNDLTEAYAQLTDYTGKVAAFLTANGIEPSEIYASAPEMEDRRANRYDSNTTGPRYFLTAVTTVSSNKVEAVRDLINRQGELLAKGVPVAAGGYSNRISYDFYGLNDIKPGMIADATANARLAAEKFADDSHSNLGKIKNASQGQFSISDRDDYTPYIKRVRVVTYLTYYLKD